MSIENKDKLKKETMDKWSSIFPGIDSQDSIKWDHKIDTSMFPISKRISSQTIGMNLVSVSPMGNTSEENTKISNEIKSINRNRKIESLIEDKKFEEMKIQDHPEYKGPHGNLFYLDYIYGSTCSTK